MAVALAPTVLHKDNKPTFTTSAWTSLMLFGMAVTFATMSLWMSAGIAFAVGAMYVALACQRYRINKRAGKPLVEIPY